MTGNIQDSILYLLITDDDFTRLAGSQLSDECFENETARLLYSITTSYIEKYKKAPGKHFSDEIIRYIESWNFDENKREVIARYLDHIQNLKPNKDYILDRLNDFVLERTLTEAVYDIAEKVKSGKYEQALSSMSKALRSGIGKQDTGTDYTSCADIQSRSDKPERLFSLGINYIDKHVYISRGDLIDIAGIQKEGKTWFCQYMANQALLAGLNVLHVSHEVSAEETIIRYDQIFGSLVKAAEPQLVEVQYSKDGKWCKERLLRATVYDKEAVTAARKRIGTFGGRLHIKKFPMHSCTMQELRAYIDNLENYHDFVPDVVINDYADLMRTVGEGTPRDRINEVYMDLKGLADEKHIVVINPSQVNERGADELRRFYSLDGNNLSEDRRKLANIDRGFYICEYTPANDLGFKESVVGCFANRSGIKPNRLILGQNLSIGCMRLYSLPFKEK